MVIFAMTLNAFITVFTLLTTWNCELLSQKATCQLRQGFADLDPWFLGILVVTDPVPMCYFPFLEYWCTSRQQVWRLDHELSQQVSV